MILKQYNFSLAKSQPTVPGCAFQFNIKKRAQWKCLERIFPNGFPVMIMDPNWIVKMKLKYSKSHIRWFKRMPVVRAQKAGILATWSATLQLGDAIKMVEDWEYKVINILPWIKINADGTPYRIP